MKRWILFIVVLVLAVAAGAAYTQRGAIAVAMLERAAPRALQNSATANLPDGLNVAFCGTGGPLPDRDRGGPCLAVRAGTRLFVFDVGEGAAGTLSQIGFAPNEIEAVFLTHLHSDHIDGLGPLALQHWGGASATAPLLVHGPAGVERVVAGFNEAYAIDSTYRVAHHGPQIMPPSGFGLMAAPFVMPEGSDRVVLVDDGGVRITAFLVDHAPVQGAVGYRIDYKNRSVVISGDTKPTPSVAREAQGVDLLVHEALSPRLANIVGGAARAAGRTGVGTIFHDIQDYHTSPEQAAEVAQEAGAKALALTHIVPALPLPGLDVAFLGDAPTKFNGPMWIARDGDVVSLPAGGGMTRMHINR